MSLFRKYRPKSFKGIYGNIELVKSITNAIESGELSNALLFHGPAGTGKTTIARIIANTIGCDTGSGDYKEYNSADSRKLDDIRRIVKSINYAPMNGDYRVIVLDEAHQIGAGGSSDKNEAQNALLKALEEPPEFVFFILCTTVPSMLLKTIRSRCVTYETKPISDKEMLKLLMKVCKAEKAKVPKDALNKIITVSEGRCREALTNLERIIYLDQDEMVKEVQKIESTEKYAIDLCRNLLKGGSWKTVSEIIQNISEDSETVRRIVLGYMSSVVKNKPSEKAHDIMYAFLKEPFYDCGKERLMYVCHGLINGFPI